MVKFVDLSAERHVVAGLLQEPSLLGKVGEYNLSFADFEDYEYSKLYDIIFTSYLKGKISRAEIIRSAQAEGFSKEFISTLLKEKVDTASFERALARVKDLSLRRKFSRLVESLTEQLEQGEDLKKLTNLVFMYLDNFFLTDKKEVDYAEVGLDIANFVQKLKTERQSLSGIPTGFTELDKLLGGLRKGELTIVLGDTGVGKTSFMLSMALNIAEQGKVVGIANYSLSTDALYERLLAITSYVPLNAIKNRALSQEDLESINNAMAKLNTLKLFIFQGVWYSLTELTSKTKRLKETHGLDVLFIDYLQLINPQTKRSTMVEEYEDTMRVLKAMARKLDIPIVLLVHTHFINHKSGKLLTEALPVKRIEHYADNVLLLSRPELKQRTPRPEDMGIAEVKMIKNLQAVETIRLAFIKEITAFKNLANYLINIYTEGDEDDDWDYDF